MVNVDLTLTDKNYNPGVQANFWAGKRVLVTGHTGFKGAWLAFWLVQMGARVTGFALPPVGEHNLFAMLDTDIDHVVGDVRDADAVTRVIKDTQPDVVFHLAAQPLVQVAYDNPVDCFATNVMGTVNVLNALRGCASVRAAVMVTSDKVYQNQEWDWRYREDDHLGGDDPYSASKAGAEAAIHAFRKSYDLPHVISVRSGNVIGGGDFSDYRIVPDIVRAAMSADKTVHIRNPHATRPWMHVLDSLAGYLMTAQLAHGGDLKLGSLNFGPLDPTPLPVGDLAHRLATKLGATVKVGQGDAAKPENQRLAIDPTRAVMTLGWRPLLDMQQTLDLTADWYQAWAKGMDMKDISANHLKRWIQNQPQAVPA